MSEIKKTLEILKARWPEVTLIIGLTVLSLFTNRLLQILKTTINPLYVLVIPILGCSMALLIITTLLQIGFKRTVYLQGQKRQSPVALLRQGKHFFWRLVGFGLIYMGVLVILAWLTFLTVKQFTSIETSFWETAKASPIAYQLCSTVPMLILIKPFLFIPSLIVVLDCRIFESFRLLKLCRLRDAKELTILFLVSMVASFLWVYLPTMRSASTIPQYILVTAQSFAQHFISLMMAVMAVRFVASQNLVYDNGSKQLDSQDSLKPSI
ncbi:MAG: hypothetical protein ABII09_10320 [Planctomycetota bacterium]